MKKLLIILLLFAFGGIANANYDLKIKMHTTTPYSAQVLENNIVEGTIAGLGDPTHTPDSFYTFCIEQGRYYNNHGVYYASIDDVVLDGGSYDYNHTGYAEVDITVKKLYAAYINEGGLSSYNISGSELQNAIWGYMYTPDDEKRISDNVEDFVARSDFNDLANGYMNVKVMNLWSDYNASTGVLYGDKQSQLIMIVPAPGAVLLAGLGTSLVGLVRRRSL